MTSVVLKLLQKKITIFLLQIFLSFLKFDFLIERYKPLCKLEILQKVSIIVRTGKIRPSNRKDFQNLLK